MPQQGPRRAVLAAGGVLTAAVTAVGGLATPAGAALGTTTVTALTTVDVLVGRTAVPAGSLLVDLNGSGAAGESVTLTVAPAGGTNCATAARALGIGGTPEVVEASNLASGTSSDVTVRLASSPACAPRGVTDQLVVTFSGSGTTGARQLLLGGFTYTAGVDTPPGPVTVTGTASAGTITTAQASNAVLRTALLVPVLPRSGTEPGAGLPLEPVSIVEAFPGALQGSVTVTLPDKGPTFGQGGTAPTVTATGGATATAAVTAPRTLTVTVTTPSSGQAGTFTVSGVRLDATPQQVGQVRAAAGTPAAPTAYGEGKVLSAVTNVTRFAGQDRYATAADTFEGLFTCGSGGTGGVPSAVLARGDAFPDALAGNYAAGRLGTGVLLTDPNVLPSAVLVALMHTGARSVTIIGGTASVSAAVEQRLASTPAYSCDGSPIMGADGTPTRLAVTRVFGADRYATAAKVAALGAGEVGTLDLTGDGAKATAVLATGVGFADALAAGPAVYAGTTGSNGNGKPFPLLLTAPDALPAPTTEALRTLGVTQVLLVGGTGAVSAGVEQQLTASGITVRRLAGMTRQETALEVAALEILPAAASGAPGGTGGGLGFNPSGALLSTGTTFADALAGGPVGGRRAAPLLLTDTPTELGDPAGLYLTLVALADGLPNGSTANGQDPTAPASFGDLVVMGGTAAVSAAVVQSALDALATSADALSSGSDSGLGDGPSTSAFAAPHARVPGADRGAWAHRAGERIAARLTG